MSTRPSHKGDILKLANVEVIKVNDTKSETDY